MVCARCGHPSSSDAGRCPKCGAPFTENVVATGVIPFDTTGLPPGATFGPTMAQPAGTPVDAPTMGDAATIGPAPPMDNATIGPAVTMGAGATIGDASTMGDAATMGTTATIGGTGAVAPHEAGPLKVGQSFGPRYHIIKLLGAGGMGAVYQAWDAELGVAVALKVIRTSKRRVSAELEKRFKNELLLARSVTHKNVVRIHDLGEIEGTKYITMSYVQGHDLSTLLRREGKFPIARALRLARQVAAGLEAAHEAGVVHRDLKPANIMIGADDLALIMDFGISASAEQATSGGIVGTLEYMAPEQGTGQAVDGRADIYAFGLILYELLTGPRLVASATPSVRVEAMKYRTTAGLPAVRSLDPSIPVALDALVTRCIERDPAARFQTSAELREALAKLGDAGELIPIAARVTKPMLAAAAGIVLLLLGGTYLTTRRLVTPAKAHEPVSVLIGDFDNRTQDPALEGSVEQTLARALEGASYVSLFDLKEARAVAKQLAPDGAQRITQQMGELIARREGLKVLMTGSVENRGTGYGVTVDVIDPASGKPLATVSNDVKDRAQLVSSVASVAVKIRAVLGESRTEMAKVAAAETFTTGSIDAMRAYARGQELFNGGKYQEALKAFQDAVALDPQFGRAYALIGNVYINLKELDKADAAFQEAMKRLDRMTEREKYRTLGGYYLGVAHNYDKAIESFDALLKAYPADSVGYTNLALAYLYQRDLPRAKDVAAKGLQLRPNDLMARVNYADYAMYSADFKAAITEANVILKQNPSYEYPYLYLALSSLASGDVDAARTAYAKLETLSPTGAALAHSGRADMEMYFGRYRAAGDLLRAGIATDLKAGMNGEAALKYVALAESNLATGLRSGASDAADKATRLSRQESVLFPAARVFIALGEDRKAKALASTLDSQLQSQSSSYARLIDGELAMKDRRLRDAIEALTDAQKRHNSWFSRFLLGRAYLDAGAGHEAEALGEFEQCLKRRGELTDVFFNDSPTLRYLPQLYYWAGRAQEAAHASAAARASFESFLKLRTQAEPPDPLVTDARARIGR